MIWPSLVYSLVLLVKWAPLRPGPVQLLGLMHISVFPRFPWLAAHTHGNIYWRRVRRALASALMSHCLCVNQRGKAPPSSPLFSQTSQYNHDLATKRPWQGLNEVDKLQDPTRRERGWGAAKKKKKKKNRTAFSRPRRPSASGWRWMIQMEVSIEHVYLPLISTTTRIQSPLCIVSKALLSPASFSLCVTNSSTLSRPWR